MEKPMLTMEDIVTIVNSSENEFIIHVEFGEEDEIDGDSKKSVQT